MLLRILFVVLTIPMCYPTLHTSGQSNRPAGSADVDRKTRQQLEQTAQSFVEAYRKRRVSKTAFRHFLLETQLSA